MSSPYKLERWKAEDGREDFGVSGPGLPTPPDGYAGELSLYRCETMIEAMNLAFDEGLEVGRASTDKDLYELWKEAETERQLLFGLLAEANAELLASRPPEPA